MIITKYRPIQKDQHIITKNQKLLLMPLGDIHEGSEGFPEKKFIDHLKWGMDMGGTFLGMGDPFDFTSDSQRAIMAPLRESTKKQLDEFMQNRVEKFADRIEFTKGHWIGMLEGNHSWQFHTGLKTGRTSDQLLCERMKCEFFGTSAFIRIAFGVQYHPEADCTVFVHHGVGGGRTQGGQLNRLEDLLKSFEADIYLMGHTHSKVNDPIDRQYIGPDGTHYHRTKLMARTGGWLRGYVSSPPKPITAPASESRGSYVEKHAMMPTSLGGLAIGIGYDRIEHSKYYRPTIHVQI
jgi:hypothetical protein